MMRPKYAKSVQVEGDGHRAPPRGYENDGLLKLMRRFNIPITRESYLNLAFMGEPPAELSAEEEQNLPPEVRKLHRK